MARKVQDIKNEMTEAFIANAEIKQLYGLDESKTFDEQFAVVSLENITFNIVAFAIWTLEKLFGLHSDEVDEKLAQLKPHTARWYRNKALAFQYGFDLLADTDKFDNQGKTPEEIETAKIIKYSAVTESDGKLTPVTAQQQKAFEQYLAEIKDAGVRTTVINYLPDRLKLNIRIVRDMLVLDANGMDITTAKYPVNEAIEEFMKELPFNGELSLQKLVDKVQQVKGVKDLKLDLAQTSWIDADINDYGNPISIAVNLTEDNETKSVITYE